MLKSIVIVPNAKTRDVGALLAIARAEAQKREKTHNSVVVRSIRFIPECSVYVALYEPPAGCSKTLGARREEKMSFG